MVRFDGERLPAQADSVSGRALACNRDVGLTKPQRTDQAIIGGDTEQNDARAAGLHRFPQTSRTCIL